MVRVFSIVNQKGGVGKTTTAITLSDCLAKAGHRTLLIDLDPQCNATGGLGFDVTTRHPFATGTQIAENVQITQNPKLEILAGSGHFSDIEALSRQDDNLSDRIQQQLRQELKVYDYVLIDCPPSLGHLTQLALLASTEVLMPIQCEYFAMEGLAQMIEVIVGAMKDRPGRQLGHDGILLTMYDASLNLTYEVEQNVREQCGDIVFKTVIPRDVTFSESQSYGQSILDFAPRSRGARAYMELCMEIQALG